MSRTAPPADDSSPVLDDALLRGLHEAVTDDVAEALAGAAPADPQALARIKHRLMARIADDLLPRHHTVLPDDGPWRTAGPGLLLKKLHVDAAGTWSYLMRLAPGAKLPPHHHPVDEECVVLEGVVRIGALLLGPGGFHLGRQGVPHAELSSDSGALIFLRGAAPKAELVI